jgi:HAD superfamily hydrolase (TIGR01484 family)
MTTHYRKELAQLAQTYSSALSAEKSNVERLKVAICDASESSVIGVGSGGSFTVASLLCNLHETYTGRVSRASTPLEIICNPTLASASPVFLISAEGKNPDITEALERARRHSARTVHVLTNRSTSPLLECAKKLTDVSTHFFELADKDGYLATNSLLLDAVLIARVYAELNQSKNSLPGRLAELRIGDLTIDQWVEQAQPFVKESVARKALTVIYSPLLRPIASDLESKLCEGALLHIQLADLRSFAHGRHLWLATRPQDCAILALIEPSLSRLWENMRVLFPPEVPTFTMSLAGAEPRELIAGLVAQMHLIASVAELQGKDAGRPVVPQFGRDLYYVKDLTALIPTPLEAVDYAEKSKYEVLGARWPSERSHGPMRRAHAEYKASIERRGFRAIVFDYDGTLSSSQRSENPPSSTILAHLERLVNFGVIVGIASGRGGSIQEHLQETLPPHILAKIQLGLYNGGWLDNAARKPVESKETSEFLSHVTRIVLRLRKLGVPITRTGVRTTHPYQVSVRFREGLLTDNMWFVIADALRQAGLSPSSIVRSKHSVDILAAGMGKSRLIAHIIQTFKIDPYDILTMGDQGAWPGNDSTLLEHRFSLSVDVPSVVSTVDGNWLLHINGTSMQHFGTLIASSTRAKAGSSLFLSQIQRPTYPNARRERGYVTCGCHAVARL